jgi:hypothetical protein
MRVGGIGGPAIGDPPRRTADRRAPPAAETESRALIAEAAPVSGDRSLPRTRTPAAPFLAQLIATRMQAPQTRARRRAAPEDAIAAYGAHTVGGPAGRALRRQV